MTDVTDEFTPCLFTSAGISLATHSALRNIVHLIVSGPKLCITFSIFPSGSEAVYVSKALQKAKIEVNEDGTKAAAATGKY